MTSMRVDLRLRWRAGVLVAGVAWFSGCLTDEGGSGPEPSSLSKVSVADGQSAPAGTRLPIPLRVTARAEDGAVVARAEVSWEVVSGPAGSSLTDSVTLTDGNGVAQVDVRLGPQEGTYTVRAALRIAADVAVTFMATATAAPEITGVSPATFTGGEVITLTGTNLTAAAAFTIGNAEAVVQQSAATEVQVLVPMCLPIGAVEIRMVVGDTRTQPFPASYQLGDDMIDLNPGEYVSVAPTAVAGCAAFPAATASGAEYLVAPQSLSSSPGDSTAYRLRTAPDVTPSVVTASGAGAPAWATRFHDHLRALEAELAAAPHPEQLMRVEAMRSTPAIAVGHRREFAVCSQIPCTTQNFETIRAEARFVGDRAAIYEDLDAPPGGFTEGDFQEFGQIFDDDLYAVDTDAFGAESDVDANGVVVILLTPGVNRLTDPDECNVSFVTGFFFAVDIDPAFATDPRSNRGEVFYGLVPDPDGTVTCTHTANSVRNLLPVTFVHEFQHMINYHQRVLVRGGTTTEVLWLNEAMSHLAEELAAFRFRDRGDNAGFNRFAIGNIFNLYNYLTEPGDIFTLSTTGTGTLAERGAGWAFLRWMVDRHGTTIIRRLSETRLRGIENVEAATGVPIDVLLSRWFFANWVSDLPNFTAPPAVRYESWQFRTTYASLNEQAPDTFDRPYPLVPTDVSGLASFDHTGILRAGSGEYFLVRQGASDPAISLQFTDPDGDPLTAASGAALNVIRIR